MRVEYQPNASALLPAPEPGRKAPGYREDEPYIAFPGQGTGPDTGAPLTSSTGKWLARWRRWRDGFEQQIGPAARRYWALYRAWDEGASPGPNQEWRDRTVIPECYKIIETRVPRIVLGTWGKPEPFAVEGRGFRDESYEEMCQVLIQTHLDEIGKGEAQAELFLKRAIDAERYKQIMGHVWWRVNWKKLYQWLKTKLPVVGDDGKVRSWSSVELQELIYDGLDVQWLPLDSIAVDLGGLGNNRRWAIERVQTSLEDLESENAKYRREHGRDLYKNLGLLRRNMAATPVQRESYEEPRDTEHWPLTDDQITDDPGETRVEMWLCWDNRKGTLTKLANRSVELAHGLAPTPTGKDPYIGVPAVPVPGRVYGDSILHWVGPLVRYQTRIARARADEVLLNIWQQYLYRSGSIRSTQWFWRPGGAMAIEQSDPTKPVDHDVKLLQRRPVFQEAFTEESYRQRQAEDTAAADPIAQGIEATTKSRDVSATEVNQRVLQGASRYQLEILYNEVAFKKPFLQMVFDSIRQNLTQPKMIRILEDTEDFTPIDLRQLERPIDIVVGGGVMEATQQERTNELREMVNLGDSPNYGPFIKHGEVIKELFKSSRTLSKNARRFVRTEEEVRSAQAAQLAASQPGASQGALPQAPQATAPTSQPQALGQGGGPGPEGLANAAGQMGGAPSGASEELTVEI